MAGQPPSKGAPPPREGPCILVVWREAKAKSVHHMGRYFPQPHHNETAAEAACFEWFAARRCLIESMVWAWGTIPASVTRTQRVLLG